MNDLKFTTAGDYIMDQQNYQVTAEELRQIVERVETLENEKRDVMDQQKDVYNDAKGRGYDVKVLKKIVAMRKRNRDDIDNENAVTELYMDALGM
jgi:uncharacterized protein (UPF0335 family)